jgi:hypothetical protein
MSNLPIIARNTLAGLTDEAGALYLRGFERDEGRAFRAASEWQDQLAPFLEAVSVMTGDVLAFIRERHFRRYFPDGRQ